MLGNWCSRLSTPHVLRIEALSYDADLASSIATAALALGAERVPLRFIGSSRILREQALADDV